MAFFLFFSVGIHNVSSYSLQQRDRKKYWLSPNLPKYSIKIKSSKSWLCTPDGNINSWFENKTFFHSPQFGYRSNVFDTDTDTEAKFQKSKPGEYCSPANTIQFVINEHHHFKYILYCNHGYFYVYTHVRLPKSEFKLNIRNKCL